MAQGRLLLALALFAPAFLTQLHAAESATGSPVVEDDRPANDKKFVNHSAWITSCNYGVFTIAEPTDSPTHVQALQQDLATLPNNPWAGHTIVVTHYAVYMNAKHNLRVGTAVGGMVGALIHNASQRSDNAGANANDAPVDETPYETDPANQHGCSANEMDGGWYVANAINNRLPPLVTEIVASVDGQQVKVRTVYTPSGNFIPKLRSEHSREELANAVKQANSVFAQKIAQLSPAMMPPSLAPASKASASVPTLQNTPSPQRANDTPSVQTNSRTNTATSSFAVKPPTPTVSAASVAQAAPRPDPSIAPAPGANSLWLSNANAVASQLGCGSALPSGGSSFVAQCSGYKVAIDCDGSSCHPTHTIADN